MIRLREFARLPGGASAVEFAIVVPFLILLMGGIIQISALFFMQNNMVNVARETARSVAIEDMDKAEAEAAAAAALVGWGTNFDITVVNPMETVDPNDTDVVVTISIPFTDATVISIIDELEVGDLRASVSMRSEGV